MRDAADGDEVARERRGLFHERRGELAERRDGVDAPERDAKRPAAVPHFTRLIEKFLQRDRLLVADVIDAANSRLDDGGFARAQIIDRRDELKRHRLAPYPPHPPLGAPARAAAHLDAP